MQTPMIRNTQCDDGCSNTPTMEKQQLSERPASLGIMGDLIEGPPNTPPYITALYRIEGFKGVFICPSLCQKTQIPRIADVVFPSLGIHGKVQSACLTH